MKTFFNAPVVAALTVSLVLLSCLVFASLSTLHADIWVPPWGEAIYDSTFINIRAEGNYTSVEVITRTAVVKLVNDDYILTLSRTTAIGDCDEDEAQVDVADSLIDFDIEENNLELQYLSTVALEDTLVISVRSCYGYDAENEEDALSELGFTQTIRRTSEDPYWIDIIGSPVYDSAPYVVLVNSNTNVVLSRWDPENDRWDRCGDGQTITLQGEMGMVWDESVSHQLGLRLEIREDGDMS
ncbi:MAG TPA: hypothetical protein ENL08_01290, partial [Bacteroidetes bacterium]|nr:hypothetical protein [Bacteroidota bacterium]